MKYHIPDLVDGILIFYDLADLTLQVAEVLPGARIVYRNCRSQLPVTQAHRTIWSSYRILSGMGRARLHRVVEAAQPRNFDHGNPMVDSSILRPSSGSITSNEPGRFLNDKKLLFGEYMKRQVKLSMPLKMPRRV